MNNSCSICYVKEIYLYVSICILYIHIQIHVQIFGQKLHPSMSTASLAVAFWRKDGVCTYHAPACRSARLLRRPGGGRFSQEGWIFEKNGGRLQLHHEKVEALNNKTRTTLAGKVVTFRNFTPLIHLQFPHATTQQLDPKPRKSLGHLGVQ